MLLEEKLRPNVTTNADVRDLLTVSLLVGLTLVLLNQPLSHLTHFIRTSNWGSLQELLQDLAVLSISTYLLLAMAFALPLRRGAIDLSIWTVACLGGIVPVLLIRRGCPLGLAVAAGPVAGLVVGAIQAGLVAFLKLPSPLVTLGTAALLIQVLPLVTGPAGQDGAAPRGVPSTGPAGHRGAAPRGGPREIWVPDHTFDAWCLSQMSRSEGGEEEAAGDEDGHAQVVYLPLSFTRMVLTGLIFAMALLVLLGLMFVNAHQEGSWSLSPRWQLFAALCASSFLAATAGALWLVEYNKAPVPTRLVDDLRAPAAALLAGAALLGGRGRTLLCLILLPGAVLLAIFWRQNVWPMSWAGLDLQMLLLIFMALLLQVGVRQVLSLRTVNRKLAALAVISMGCGIILLAQTANMDSPFSRRLFYLGGLGGFAAGTICLVVVRSNAIRARRQDRSPRPTVTPPPG